MTLGEKLLCRSIPDNLRKLFSVLENRHNLNEKGATMTLQYNSERMRTVIACLEPKAVDLLNSKEGLRNGNTLSLFGIMCEYSGVGEWEPSPTPNRQFVYRVLAPNSFGKGVSFLMELPYLVAIYYSLNNEAYNLIKIIAESNLSSDKMAKLLSAIFTENHR